MSKYEHVFSPLKVGPVTIKNRIIWGPHVTNHWTNFLPDDRIAAYYEERAKGGVGMIIIGASSVDETADYYPFTQCGMWMDDVIPGLRKIADAVHKHDTKVLIQIMHPGVHQIPERDDVHPARAPSEVPAIEDPSYIPKELEKEEIWEIEEKFAKAAERAKKAGLDGVEIHGAHGYLIWSFLTPLKNKRTDEYGGSLENRFRFLREIIEKVRDRVGRDFVVGVRIINNDMYPGGMETDEIVEVAKMIEATGKVDYINVSTGLYRSFPIMIPSHYAGFPPGYQGEFTRKIKAAVKSIPVFQTGRINDAALIERIIASGDADGVIVIRQLIADPEFPNKAKEGREEDIRPCMYCNQNCIAHIIQGTRVSCQINAAADHELEWGIGTLTRASKRKKVVIVGAGPGGLECARVAAERGHDVVVYEKENEVGGQVRLFARLPNRSEPKDFITWLERQCNKHGVRFRLGTEVTAQNIDQILREEGADAVVIATGSRAARDGRSSVTTEPIPGWQSASVLTYEEVLTGAATVGNSVLIVDELGDRIAPGLAEMLAEQGKKVEIVTRWPNVSHYWLFYWNEQPLVYGRLSSLGIQVIPNTWVKSIEGGKVTLYNVYNSSAEEQRQYDTVILTTMKYANNQLYRALKDRGLSELYLIGDAVAPRRITHAVHDGHRVARQL